MNKMVLELWNFCTRGSTCLITNSVCKIIVQGDELIFLKPDAPSLCFIVPMKMTQTQPHLSKVFQLSSRIIRRC